MEPGQQNKKNNNARETEDREKGSQGVAINPNPRANENLRTETTGQEAGEKNETSDVGTEITDGEDA